MVLLGCRPNGRLIEQHDIFFGIANSMKELVPEFKKFWPEAKGIMHVDAWREVRNSNGYRIKIVPTDAVKKVTEGMPQLFFINLGGYKPTEFEEYHYKMVVAGADKGDAVRISKQTAFYKHFGFKGAESHIDDKYGIDVDDFFAIDDILAPQFKEKYAIVLQPTRVTEDDVLNIGYFKLDKL